MSAIFSNTASSKIIKSSTTGNLVASIHLSENGGDNLELFTAPVISIDELSHRRRQQLDCTLDGTVHVLTANGGVAACSLTCLDRLPNNCSNSSETQSALRVYQELRNKPGARIEVMIHAADVAGSPLAHFIGVLNSCTATVRMEKDTAYVIAKYSMMGTWS